MAENPHYNELRQLLNEFKVEYLQMERLAAEVIPQWLET